MENATRIELKNIDEKLDRIEKTVERLDESIRGNGKAGLQARVAALEDWQEDLSDDIKWLTRSVLGLAIVIGIEWLGQLFF